MQSVPLDTVVADASLSQRAAVAVALAPVLVLLSLTLVIGDLLDPALGLAASIGGIVWLVYEMHRYQRWIDPLEDETALDDWLHEPR